MNNTLCLLLITPDILYRKRITNRINKLDLFSINAVNNAIEAIELLKTVNYHFIISDIHTGQIDGWRLSSLIRSNIYLCAKNVPIVLITETHCEHIAEVTAKSFGINAIITKDDDSQLNEILADAFSKSLPLNNKNLTLLVSHNDDLFTEWQRILSDKFQLQKTRDTSYLPTFRQTLFDFVLIDANAYPNTSLTIMNIMRQENESIPIVVLIPKGRFDLAEKFILQGASDFIYVPYTSSKVVQICQRAVWRNDFMISNLQFSEKAIQLEASENNYRELTENHTRLLENLTSVVMELDTEGNIKFINSPWKTLTGFSIDQCVGKKLADYVDDEDISFNHFSYQLSELLSQQTQSAINEFKLQTFQQDSIWVEMRFQQLLNNGQFSGLTLTIDNIDERKLAEEKLNHIALHDTLTGLYNRYYFDNELNRLAHLSARSGKLHSLLYIDLDHFKIINDTEGHPTWDLVLKEVAHILSERLRQSDVLCRIGGDEFVILLDDSSLKSATEVGRNICQNIAKTHFQFNQNTYRISASVGISEINGHYSASEYLKQADIALYVAKDKGRDGIHCYHISDSETNEHLNNTSWLRQIQSAISHDDLMLHFQPIWDINTSEIAYFEALVRLNIDNELIYPDSFIPILEKSLDIYSLDREVIIKSIQTISLHPNLKKIAINLSAQGFSDERLLPLIEENLVKYNVDGDAIIFELTESASLTNIAGTKRMIQKLSHLGCQFFIDDFGTGFSTFAYLKELPAHAIKIDGSFVKDMCTNPADHTLVSAISNIAKSLGKQCVAEFVEDMQIFRSLQTLGIRYAQGYLISKPVPIEEIDQILFDPQQKIT